MTSDSEPDPSTRRRRAIADSLRQYLSDATSIPPAPTPEPDDSIGWFAPAPAGHEVYGREPWTRMRDVEVGVAGHAVAVSFTWLPDDNPTRSYVVVLHIPDWDEITGSNSLVTTLDLLLDRPDWQTRLHPVGGDVFVVLPHF
ncbi:hypothetical protein [Prescottella equi]|uniref:hypothetical protein n=1 Tax=Rhodococcus hoagii TaxID=43767 RepID=UPI001C754F55|nr:hypothetical protein [Prescottella equi]BCN45327.1 hypothetical protein RE9414_36070 [Prescottella equi]